MTLLFSLLIKFLAVSCCYAFLGAVCDEEADIVHACPSALNDSRRGQLSAYEVPYRS